ncbi:zinc finger BED domain-containing protein RICESLEEPER 2-like [Capsicum chacoense]
MFKQLSNWGTNIMEGQHLHVRCMTHILNLIVQDGLKEIDKSVKRVRQAVKYVKQSAARVKKFKECCESQLITCITCKKSLCLDAPSRWNSTYLMLETTQHFELAFERYSFYDNGFLDYLCTSPCEDGTKAGAFVSGDWENVRTMVKFLKTFYDLTLKVFGSKYVTTNVHFVEIAELDLILKEKMNKMIFISSVLDLFNKLEYVSFAIVDMFEKEIGEKLFDSVESYIKALFEHYVKKSKNSSSSSSSSYSWNSSSISGYGSFQRREIMRTKQQFEKHKEISGGSSNKSELRKYLAEEIESDSEQFDILCWWKVNEPRFPILVEMARDVLVIPISSVASECAFSMVGWVIDPFRSSLTPKLVQSLICLQD